MTSRALERCRCRLPTAWKRTTRRWADSAPGAPSLWLLARCRGGRSSLRPTTGGLLHMASLDFSSIVKGRRSGHACQCTRAGEVVASGLPCHCPPQCSFRYFGYGLAPDGNPLSSIIFGGNVSNGDYLGIEPSTGKTCSLSNTTESATCYPYKQASMLGYWDERWAPWALRCATVLCSQYLPGRCSHLRVLLALASGAGRVDWLPWLVHRGAGMQ